MPQGHKKNGLDDSKCPSARKRDATLTMSVVDPFFDTVGFISPPLKLYTLKQHLARFSLVESRDPAGFNFDNFRKNIRGLKYVLVEGISLEILFTRSSVFLTLHGPPGKMKQLSPALGPDALGRISVAVDSEGQMLTICRITSLELKKILEASSLGQKGIINIDSILPPESAEYIEPDEFRQKLGKCSVIKSKGDFSLSAFASRINIVRVFKDEQEGINFIIALKDGDDAVYIMYVNPKTPFASKQNQILCQFRYNKDECIIVKVETIE